MKKQAFNDLKKKLNPGDINEDIQEILNASELQTTDNIDDDFDAFGKNTYNINDN